MLTRSEDSARKLPEGATGVLGDLTDPDTYEQVFTDFDKLFLLNAVSITELVFQEQGLAATDEGLREMARIVGHSPRDFDDFTRKTVAGWT